MAGMGCEGKNKTEHGEDAVEASELRRGWQPSPHTGLPHLATTFTATGTRATAEGGRCLGRLRLRASATGECKYRVEVGGLESLATTSARQGQLCVSSLTHAPSEDHLGAPATEFPPRTRPSRATQGCAPPIM